MESIYILIPVALGFAGVGIWAFFWAVDTDQYEDLDREGQRILFDEDKKKTTIKNTDTDITTPSPGSDNDEARQ